MIKDRRIIVSLGLIAVLLLYLLLSGKNKKSGDIPEIKKLDNIDEILITKSDKQIRLYNSENKWLINDGGYPADKNKIEKLEKEMKELEITDFISKGPYYMNYDLTPEKAINVVVKNKGKIERNILIGKASSTYRNTYIKFADNDKIYLASGNLSDEYNKDIDDLRDKEIIKAGREEVGWIELVYRGSKLTFEKKTEEIEADNDKDKNTAEKKKTKIETWICKEYMNINIDKSKVDSLAASLSSLNAESYPDLKIKDLKGLTCQIKTKIYNKEIELKIYNKDKDNYLCSSSESPYVFTLREWNAKKFFKQLGDFKQDSKEGKK